MALPQLPPPIDISTETKKGIIDGLKKVIEALQAHDAVDKAITYQDVIHDPDVLHAFIAAYRANGEVAGKMVVDKAGKPVTDENAPLSCGISLAQIQQLLVKTCARYVLEQESKDEEEIVTETVTKTRFLIFKKTEQIERRSNSGDERRIRELVRYMAFDWQLPLLSAFGALNSAQLLELDELVLALQTSEAIHELAQFDQATLKKVKGIVGADFPNILAHRPAAIGGIVGWPKEMYAFYRNVLGEKAFDFFCRDKQFFMVCAALDKPLTRIYGDVLCYIAAENLQEMQRLNIDKADVLIAAMRSAFGERMASILAQPNFAKDILRKLVESLLHLTQEKAQLAISAQLTCKAIAPQVIDWLAKQPR